MGSLVGGRICGERVVWANRCGGDLPRFSATRHNAVGPVDEVWQARSSLRSHTLSSRLMLNTLLALSVAFPPSAPPPNPRALIDSAIAAMQRSAQLRSIKAYRLNGTQHEYVLGNGERADGPFWPI